MVSITTKGLLPKGCEPIVYQWFEALQERNQCYFSSVNGRALRAELRRASLFDGVLMSQAYLFLNNAFFGVYKNKDGIQQLALAMFAAAAVHAKKNEKNAAFAAQLSEKVNGSERSYLSRERFNRLLKADSPEEFTRQLIRAVKLRGEKGVNLFSLAEGIFLWMDEWYRKEQNQPADPNPFNRIAVRWATEYFN